VLLGSMTMLLVVFFLKVANGKQANGNGVVGSGNPTRKSFGWTAVLLGADGRLSTSKFQIFLWTMGMAYALAYLTGISVFLNKSVLALNGGDTAGTAWSDYLILLGGPFAAGVLAKFAVVSKLTGGSLDKTLVAGLSDPSAIVTSPAASSTPADGAAAPADSLTKSKGLLTNDAGNLDLVDAQYLVFNLVAFVYAAAVFISRNFNSAVADTVKYDLPLIPAVLLGLTGVSAATYVGNKAVQQSGPRISAIEPTAPAAGTPVIVRGVNLVPPGTAFAAAQSMTTVLVTGPDGALLASLAPTDVTATTVTFDLPPNAAGKTVDVTIVTASGLSTAPFALKVS
jgi:hypothetical protein